jgi:uncharacterized protein (UPF0264 family)
MTRLLVSVTDVNEALLALEAGADIIDMKNPAQGALGALPLPVIREVVQAVDGRRPVSATVGDLPMQPELVAAAVAATAATGVDIVKVGFFGRSGHVACAEAIAPLTSGGVNVVAVLFADTAPDFGLPALLADAGFYGVMLDTVGKDGRSLLDWLSFPQLREFTETSRALGLLTGLAGSLSITDIPALSQTAPDYLGFRGGMCWESLRQNGLDQERIRKTARVLRDYNIPDGVAA